MSQTLGFVQLLVLTYVFIGVYLTIGAAIALVATLKTPEEIDNKTLGFVLLGWPIVLHVVFVNWGGLKA